MFINYDEQDSFDFPESESELVAGYHCEYSGMKFAMLFLAEYALTFVICTYMTALFMGGYNSPVGFYLADLFNLNNGFDYILKNIEQLFWISIKTFLLIYKKKIYNSTNYMIIVLDLIKLWNYAGIY